MLLHGDGKSTRRYLWAGDACDAFDTILHRGVMGSVYNIPSSEEVSNITLCRKLLDVFGYDPSAFDQKVKHTQDRPFNDKRYAVNGDKLKQLGWTQKKSLKDGLAETVQWYRRFGESRNLRQ